MAEDITASDDLIFVIGEAFKEDRFNVYALNTTPTSTGDLSIRNIFSFKPTKPYIRGNDINFAVCGSKLCAVGAGFDMKTNRFVGEFLMWDLTNWKLRQNNSFKSKNRPGPRGAKPRPIVFSVDDRLFVLSGLLYYENLDIPHPAFEVYDPYGKSEWKPLSEPPPFRKFYSDGSRFICGYKVVDTILYVAFSPDENDKLSYYSYDVNTDKWSEDEIDIDKADMFFTNMIKFGHWLKNEDFDDDKRMFFHSSGTRVLACDLEAKVSDRRRTKHPHAFARTDNDYSFYDGYPYVPVCGLTHVRDGNGQNHTTSGFVAHLDGNIYCAVHLFDDLDNEDDYCLSIHACKFELIKQNGEKFNALGDKLSANVLACGQFVNVRWNRIFLDQWYKIKSRTRGSTKA